MSSFYIGILFSIYINLYFIDIKIILKTSASPTSASLPQGQFLQTADGQLIILQSAEQSQAQQPQYVQVGGQSKSYLVILFLILIEFIL